MKFSDEMKMMLQIQQLTLQKQKQANLRAAQADYSKLLQKILSDLKAQIRHDIATGKFSLKIEGDCELQVSPMVQCDVIPQLEEKSPLYDYQTVDGINYFCWGEICRGLYDGKRMASKNVCIELTEAGKRLMSDLICGALEDGIQLTFQPALHTKTDTVILPKFGHYENVPGLRHGKKGVLNDFYVNMHYEIL